MCKAAAAWSIDCTHRKIAHNIHITWMILKWKLWLYWNWREKCNVFVFSYCDFIWKDYDIGSLLVFCRFVQREVKPGLQCKVRECRRENKRWEPWSNNLYLLTINIQPDIKNLIVVVNCSQHTYSIRTNGLCESLEGWVSDLILIPS